MPDLPGDGEIATTIVVNSPRISGDWETTQVPRMDSHGRPPRQGLYDPRNEHDACGVGFVAHIKGKKSHDIVEKGLTILNNLRHRGATGADPLHGDGAGLLVQIPDAFFREEMGKRNVKLPKAGAYGVGMVFLPRNPAALAACTREIERAIANEGQTLLGWRDVPVDDSSLGETARRTMPVIRQVFVGAGRGSLDRDAFERKLYIVRKASGHAVRALGLANAGEFYVPSFSHRTIVYKGMLLAEQIGPFYKDLSDKRFTSALCLAHQRFSTNTFPSWDLAHPFRFIAHNGEINTLRGNLNWIKSRQATIHSKLLGEDLDKIWPLIYDGQSDSASFDNALELLVMGGYPIAHAMMLMIPEAWAGNPLMDAKRRAFYEYHAALMEPWDGPAAVAFTDGKFIGATLDRNGLRPARYFITDDDLIVMSSEMGVLDIPQEKIVRKWRLQPGKMLLVDIEHGRIVSDDELKRDLAAQRPYQDWLDRTQIRLEDIPTPWEIPTPDTDKLLHRQQAFGYTQEDLKMLMTPMALAGEEPIGSMGDDAPLAVLSNRAKPLYAYFRQLFAQVTNPPIDPIREQLVMSLVSFIGPRPNLLSPDQTEPVMRLEVSQPILTFEDMEKLRRASTFTQGHFKSDIFSMCYPAEWGTAGMEPALAQLCADAEDVVRKGTNIVILTDREVSATKVPIPALLATAAVHHHLVRAGLRTRCGLVVETGSAREVHHFACLAGYGAEAIHPNVAFATLIDMAGELPQKVDEKEIVKRYIKAIGKGMLKVMSKMGISTYQSYCGAQIFEVVGLAEKFVEKYFTGTPTAVEGIGMEEVAEEAVRLHRLAYSDAPLYRDQLDAGGEYAYRIRGEAHMWTPDSIAKLQHAARSGSYATFKEYSGLINEQSERLLTLRGLFRIKEAAHPVPIEEVESAKDIVRRFATGAMSLGSISHEAHSHARHRDEPHRRQVQHRRRRRRPDPLHPARQRRLHALVDQAGGGGALRRDHRVPGERRRPADQDGAGRETRRGRPASRPQGLQVHRQGAPHGAGRGPHLAAAAPRHLLHRGPGAADPRPEEREPRRAHLGEAGERDRRGHGGRGCRQGQERPRDHLRPRRRHGRLAALVGEVRRQPVGDRPRGNAADAGAEPPARAHRGAGRRPDEDRPRRGRGRAAGCRRVRFRHGAAGGAGLHHDAQVPPEHLPGRHRHAGSGAHQEVRGQARARHQLFLLRRRGSARVDGEDGIAQVRRDDRPHRPAGYPPGRGALEGARPRLLAPLLPSRQRGRRCAAPVRVAGPRPRQGPRPRADRQGGGGARRPAAGAVREPDLQPQPHRGRHALGRSRAPLRPRGPARGHHPRVVQGHRGPELRRVARARRDLRARRRRQRLRGQGPVAAGASWSIRPRRAPSCPRRTSSSATP